jgi:hypothetical protein
MKKAFIIIILLCLGTTAGAYYVIYEPFTEKLVAEQILPSETLLAIRIDQLTQRIDNFRASRLGMAMADIDVQIALTALEAPADSIPKVQDWLAHVNDSIDRPWFDALFGQQVTLALLPITVSDFDQPSPDGLSQALVFVLRPEHPARFLDWMTPFVAPDLEVTSENYGQWTVNHFELATGGTVHYSITGGLVVFALHRHPVVRCLDTLKHPAASLGQNPDYQDVERELTDDPAPHIVGYVNLGEIYEMALDMVAENAADRPELDLLEKQFSRMNGFYAAGYAAYDDGSPVHQEKMVFMVDRAGLEPQMERALSIRPQTAAMLSMLPEDTLGFFWQNTLDLKLYHDSLMESQDLQPESLAAVNPFVQEKLGASVEELINAFGPQWGMAMQDIKTGGFFPIPELGIFIQSSRPEIMAGIIQQAAATAEMGLLTETYGSHQISYLQLPFGSDLSPAYAYINGYCVVAVNTNIIKSYIDTFTSGRNITGSDAFMAVDRGLSDPNNQLTYIKFDRLMDRVPEIVQWATSMAAMAQPDKAGQVAPLVEELINPLADGLKMYKTIGSRSFFAEDRIESQVYADVEY